MKNNLIKVLLVPILFLTGCASIVGKSEFPLTVSSNPEGANISITDEKGAHVFSGRTPSTVSLTAGESYFHAKSYRIIFSKDGYGERIAEVKAGLSGWYFGNILFGGLIGLLIVDPLTGKMWKLPVSQSVDLTQQAAGKSTLQIATLDQVPEDMRSKLISLN